MPAASPSTGFVAVVAIKPVSPKFSSALKILTAQLTIVAGFLPLLSSVVALPQGACQYITRDLQAVRHFYEIES